MTCGNVLEYYVIPMYPIFFTSVCAIREMSSFILTVSRNILGQTVIYLLFESVITSPLFRKLYAPGPGCGKLSTGLVYSRPSIIVWPLYSVLNCLLCLSIPSPL